MKSKKLAIVAHCILNQNPMVVDISKSSWMMKDIILKLLKNGIGILQLPCPELLFKGLNRKKLRRDDYDTPQFHNFCEQLLKNIYKQIDQYISSGYKLCVIGIGGSPSCGVFTTHITSYKKNGNPYSKLVNNQGIFMAKLFKYLKRRGNNILFLEIPWGSDLSEKEKFFNYFERKISC